MVKAKDFLITLCDGFEYRLFSGVPTNKFLPLYKNFNSKFLHYIPTVNSNTSLGIISGSAITGLKGVLLLDFDNFYDVFSTITNFNNSYAIQLLIIIIYDEYSHIDTLYDLLKTVGLSYKEVSEDYVSDITEIDNMMESTSTPVFVFLKEGVLV